MMPFVLKIFNTTSDLVRYTLAVNNVTITVPFLLSVQMILTNLSLGNADSATTGLGDAGQTSANIAPNC